MAPDEALAARSSGRVGGSSFRSAAPSRSYSGGGGSRGYAAPPLVGGYGYGYGGMGYSSFMPPVIIGAPMGMGFGGFGFLGGMFQFFIIATVLQAVLAAVANGLGKGKDGSSGRDDQGDDTM